MLGFLRQPNLRAICDRAGEDLNEEDEIGDEEE